MPAFTDADGSGLLRARTRWADIRAGMGFVVDLMSGSTAAPD
ncbi:hypothetical protein ACIPJ2_11805 [Curtobacterium sp. NPDC090217]